MERPIMGFVHALDYSPEKYEVLERPVYEDLHDTKSRRCHVLMQVCYALIIIFQGTSPTFFIHDLQSLL
jgi:hypothetical protein